MKLMHFLKHLPLTFFLVVIVRGDQNGVAPQQYIL